jgi:predicted metal-dependent hydrolase
MKIIVNRTDRKSIAYSLEPEKLTILIPQHMPDNFRIEDVLSAVNESAACNETMTEEEFRQLVEEWVEKLHVKPKKVQIRKMKKKWASCSPGKSVLFNSLLMGMPKEFVAYVVCHELLHFKVPNHNKLFKNLLSAYMPDWRERISRTIEYFLKQKENEKNG